MNQFVKPQRLECPSCGAPLLLQAADVRVECAFCGTPLVVQDRRAYSEQPPPQADAGPTGVSTAANLSLAFGLAAWIVLPLLGAALAVLFGRRARAEIADAGGRLNGRARAELGLLLGYAQLALVIILLAASTLQSALQQ